MDILNSYPLKSKNISLRGLCKFSGVLDMKKYIELVDFDCSFNYINIIFINSTRWNTLSSE